MAGASTATPIIRTTQPWLVPYDRWCDDHAYLVDCIADNLRTCLSTSGATASTTFNWEDVRRDLRRYLYETGHSRFRAFRHHCGDKKNGYGITE